MKRINWGILVAAVAAPFAVAGSINTQADVAAGSAAVGACAGSQFFGGGMTPGFIYCANPGPIDSLYVNDGTDSKPFGQTASYSTSNSLAGVYTDSSWAQASQANLHLYSTFNETASTAFVGSVSDAGWNDTVTITGGTGSGTWNVSIWVEGELTAPGSYASESRLEVAAYKNQNLLAPTPGFYAANNSWCKIYQPLNTNCSWFGARDLSSAGYQVVTFTAYNSNTQWNTYGVPDTIQDLPIAQFVNFQIPFTYGVPFELGVWADTMASVGSSGTYPTSGTANIGQTILWGGSSVAGNPNFQATGLGGFNYNNSNVPLPEPSCFMLAAAMLGVGAAVRNRLSSRG